MASQEKLLEILATEAGPIRPAALSQKLGEKIHQFMSQLNRLVDDGKVDKTSEGEYVIVGPPLEEMPPGPLTQEGAGVTDYQQFRAIGLSIGIPEKLVDITTEHVWRGGNYKDLKWVWEALQQMAIRPDLRARWWHCWRSQLGEAIPAELKTTIDEVATTGHKEGATAKDGRDYIIFGDEPVRVGEGLGDYTMQDAKELLTIRALKDRLAGLASARQPTGGVAQAAQGASGPTEKLSEVITALTPFLKQDADTNLMKEILSDKIQLLKADILSHIPQTNITQPKSFVEQLNEFAQLMPTLKSILGIKESSGNPLPVQVKDKDGNPMVMDLNQYIGLKRFESEERRSDERHSALMGLTQTIRENLPIGIEAFSRAASEVKGKAPESAVQQYECGSCHTKFTLPREPGEDEKVICPKCGQEWTGKEVLGA